MPARVRLLDLRLSRLPKAIGSCASDIPTIADAVNSAQLRLIYAKEAGDEGWYGTWAEMAFTVSKTQPYLTCPREVARLEVAAVCDQPIPINNQFAEYMQFGNGRMPKQFQRSCAGGMLQVYSRNNVPTFVDLTNAPQYIAVYITDPADVNQNIVFTGTDANGTELYSYVSAGRIGGQIVPMVNPFTIAATPTGTPIPIQTITGIQKDLTQGPVKVYQVDPTTGAQVLLLTMAAGETVANYRRYYFDALPPSCCPGVTAAGNITVLAIVKLEPIPVTVDTDYLIIQNKEALIEEASAIRYRLVDTTGAKAMSQECHKQAVRLLNGELGHYYGTDEPSVQFKPFGSGTLEKHRVGSLV